MLIQVTVLLVDYAQIIINVLLLISDINYLSIVMLLVILLHVRLKEGGLLWVIGSWKASRIIVVQSWLVWQLVITRRRKHT